MAGISIAWMIITMMSSLLTAYLLWRLLKELIRSNALIGTSRFIKQNYAIEDYKGPMLDPFVPGKAYDRKPGTVPKGHDR